MQSEKLVHECTYLVYEQSKSVSMQMYKRLRLNSVSETDNADGLNLKIVIRGQLNRKAMELANLLSEEESRMVLAKDMGLKVPEDVSIVGVDNHELADFFGITTIDQNVTGQAELLVKTMLKVLENPEDHSGEVIDWPIELVVRSSTTKVRS